MKRGTQIKMSAYALPTPAQVYALKMADNGKMDSVIERWGHRCSPRALAALASQGKKDAAAASETTARHGAPAA